MIRYILEIPTKCLPTFLTDVMISLIGGVYLQIFTMTLIIATNPVVPGKLGFRGESQYYCVLGIMSYKSLLLPLFWRRLQKFTIRRPLKLIEGLPGCLA